MDYKFINNILKDLDSLETSKVVSFVEKRITENWSESNTYWDNYYRIIGEANLYLKVSYKSNSYNDVEVIKSIEFVKAKEIQKIEYVNID